MSDPDRSLFADFKALCGSLADDVRQSLALRFELAQIEFKGARRLIAWLTVFWLLASLAILVSLPVLVVAIAHALRDMWGLSFTGWLLLIGGGLLFGGVATALTAWRRFRRRFEGFQQTLEEIHDDLAWLREWAGKDHRAEERAAPRDD